MSQEMERVEFTREMKNDYTILVPNMLPVHFGFLLKVFEEYGYKLEILQNGGQAVVDAGLKYVHNDTCYPALLVIGQFMDALQSGKYDLHKTALLITQTGGGCRASNYIHLLRKALKKSGIGLHAGDFFKPVRSGEEQRLSVDAASFAQSIGSIGIRRFAGAFTQSDDAL